MVELHALLRRRVLVLLPLLLPSCGRLGFDGGTAPAGIEDGLVSWFAFDEVSGSSFGDGHGHTATCVSASCVTSTVAGKVGNAVPFTGVERYAMPSDPAFETPAGFTVAAWLYPLATPSQLGCAVTKVYGIELQNSWTLCMDTSNQLLFATVDSLTSTHSLYGGSVPLNQWRHTAVRWTGTEKEIWIDGQLALAGQSDAAQFDGRAISIGTDFDGTTTSTEPYEGLLDELVIYDRALTPEEIQLLAQ